MPSQRGTQQIPEKKNVIQGWGGWKNTPDFKVWLQNLAALSIFNKHVHFIYSLRLL